MIKIKNFLSGKKSYILAVLGGVTTTALMLGWLDNETYLIVMGLLGSGSIATLRSGMNQ